MAVYSGTLELKLPEIRFNTAFVGTLLEKLTVLNHNFAALQYYYLFYILDHICQQSHTNNWLLGLHNNFCNNFSKMMFIVYGYGQWNSGDPPGPQFFLLHEMDHPVGVEKQTFNVYWPNIYYTNYRLYISWTSKLHMFFSMYHDLEHWNFVIEIHKMRNCSVSFY